MRILLLNPPAEYTAREYVDPANPSDHGLLDTEDFGRFPPLGLLYILAALRKATPEHETFLLDCIAEKVGHGELMQRVAEIGPDLVGITSFTVSMYDVCLAARAIRQRFPAAHLCLGGHHPIAFPYEAAELPEFDSIIVGEGEEAFPELVTALTSGADFTGIRGVYTAASIRGYQGQLLTDDRFLARRMPPPAYVENLDALAPPDRSVISHLDYRSIVGASDRLATMISSRGCPCSCTFCDVPYKKYRQRSTVAIADEIRACLDMGYKEVHFYDDLFNITPERVIAFSDEITRRGYRFTWDFRGRVNTVTHDSLVKAKAAGCRMISFGVETGSDDGLMQLRKNCTTEQVRTVFKWCRSLGILTIADFMIGLPFEKSAADVRRNIDFMLDIDPDYAQVSILSLFPNTELFAEAARRGLIRSERWAEFARAPRADFYLDHWEESLSMADLLRLQRESYRRFYLRPRYVWRSLLATCSWHEFTTKLQGAVKLFR
ncbi:cobalamin-dependent protein [Geobacter pelophilus]|uniref:Cobalamin-dependent protein n=1 Tax=Geoanaerobacter pelophilus TaxID=60036 RepID=A0AAW4LAB9_9BACT|nr:radical SAM protein [Geoanaerobacter pelophilus]MBT0666545.1 cobalamin-dependent protein [Geoanaerobacter pelophilus]